MSRSAPARPASARLAPSRRAPAAARLLGLLVGLMTPLGATAQSQNESATYTVTVSGITAGRLDLAITRNGPRYALKSRVASAGLAGLLQPFSVVSTAKGRLGNGRLQPETYASQSDGARAGRGAEIRYDAGVPTVISAAREEEPDAVPPVDPATQKGAVDPLTATYALLQTLPEAQLCSQSLRIFDGHRASRVTLSGPEMVDGRPTCAGTYQRVAGYPPRELAKQSTFRFALHYTGLPDGMMQVQELTLDSPYGLARVTRD